MQQMLCAVMDTRIRNCKISRFAASDHEVEHVATICDQANLAGMWNRQSCFRTLLKSGVQDQKLIVMSDLKIKTKAVLDLQVKNKADNGDNIYPTKKIIFTLRIF